MRTAGQRVDLAQQGPDAGRLTPHLQQSWRGAGKFPGLNNDGRIPQCVHMQWNRLSIPIRPGLMLASCCSNQRQLISEIGQLNSKLRP